MDSWKDDDPFAQYDEPVQRHGGKDALIFMVDFKLASQIGHNDNGDTLLQKTLKCCHATLRRNNF